MSNRSWHALSVFEPIEHRVVGDDRVRASDFLAGVLLSLIACYRRFVSPLLGPSCRFHPTCSSYAIEAIRRHGPIGGLARAIARLARCHPLSAGGYDPVK